jgi:hypothetical protein
LRDGSAANRDFYARPQSVAFESFDNAFLAGHCGGQGGKADDVRVKFLGFQRKIVEGDIDAEIKTWKPLAESMEPTRVLPISWMSPFTVPRTTAECLACRAHLVDCGLQNCGFHRLALEDHVWKKHLTLLERFPDRAQS